jgi:PAS domain S-box-containing protein
LSARAHEVDMLSAAAQTPQRSEYLLFTEPHITLPGVIITRKDAGETMSLSRLAGMRVCVVSGYLWQEFIARDHPRIILDPVPDIQTGLRKISFGLADAMVENVATAVQVIEQEGIPNLQVSGESGYSTRLSFAIRKDWPELRSILDKALSAIGPAERKAVVDRYIHLSRLTMVPRKVRVMIGAVAGAVLLLICVIITWNHLLQRRVRDRTARLSSTVEQLKRESEEHRKDEDALRESERRYRFLFEQSPAGNIIIGIDGKIKDINEYFLNNLGYAKDEVIGKPAVEFIVPEERGRVAGTLKQRMAGVSVPERDNGVPAKDGSVHYIVFSSGQTQLYEGDTFRAILITGIDVTDRRKADALARRQQEQLVQADKMASLGILVSGVAHEINNPNNFIILNSDNLRDVWKDLQPRLDRQRDEHGDFQVVGLPYSEVREEMARLIDGIGDGAKRIRAIVQGLKDFARQEPGDLEQLVDVNEVLRAATLILSNLIRKSTDRFVYDLRPDIPKVKGNFQKIEQVMINLITNACQALTARAQTITAVTRGLKKACCRSGFRGPRPLKGSSRATRPCFRCSATSRPLRRRASRCW